MPDNVRAKLLKKLFKIKMLRDGALTNGERVAANNALKRGLVKAGLVEADLVPVPAWPRGLPPAGTRVMTPHGPGVVQEDAGILLDPRPMPQSFVIHVGGSGSGDFGGGWFGNSTSTSNFSATF